MIPEVLDVGFELGAIETKAEDGANVGTFSGLASTFSPDLGGDVVVRGAFAESIKTPRAIKLLWQHDTREPIGTWESMRETSKGLEVEGRLILGVQRGREAFELLRAKAVDGLSIGFSVAEGGAERDKRTGLRRLKKVDLMEVSIVTFPMNTGARVASAKAMRASGEVPGRIDCEKLLHADGWTRRQAKALLSEGYAGLSPEAAELEAVMESIRRARPRRCDDR